MKIIAGKSILHNNITNCTFIAGEVDEITQLSHHNHSHIEWVGDLNYAYPKQTPLLWELFEEIKHGDEDHQNWLKEAIQSFIDRKCST